VLPDFQGLGIGYPIFKNLAQIATHNFNHTTGHYGRCKVVTAIPALHKKMNNDIDWKFIKGSDVRKAEKPRDDDRQFGGYNEDYFKKHQHRITKAFHYVGIKGFDLENPNLVIDNILETKSWVDNKNRACNKLTGNIIKDFRPPIAGETDYQFIMESN
jgi:hypothetical protein